MINYTDDDMEMIREHGGLTYDRAEKAMIRSNLHFEQIERINNRFESHKWGSDADRKYRERSVRQAIRNVASNPLQYQ